MSSIFEAPRNAGTLCMRNTKLTILSYSLTQAQS